MQGMPLTFDDRPSDSPFVERIWRSQGERRGTFLSIAMSHWEIDSGEAPWMSHAAQAVADVLANVQRRTLKGQPHNVAPEAMAPVLIEFFKE
jgi:hypothetical protein